MGVYSSGGLFSIEGSQSVGLTTAEIYEVYQADDRPWFSGSDQDFAQEYDATAGQLLVRLPTAVAPNEPVINYFTGVIGTTVTTPTATLLTNTESTLVLWGGAGAVASYTFIQGGIGVSSGTTRFRALTNSLGVDIDINVISPVIDIGADVFATGTFIDISYDTIETTTGALDIINIFSAVNLLTLGGDLTGIRFNFAETRVTPATDQDITILEGIFPAFTQSAANTTTYRGVEMITAGALVQDTAAGTINFYGLDLATPAMQLNFAAGVLNTAVIRSNTAGLINTDTAGTVTWYGFDLTTAEVDADSTGTTTVAGFNIGTAGALNQATGAGTINWYGSRIQMPVVTETTGTVTAYGLSVVLADIVSATATSPEVAGYHFTTPADTHSLAVEITYRGIYGSAAGALVQDTAAGEIRWHGLDLVAPASTISFAASTIETAMFRVGTAGALASSTAGTHNWYGIDFVAPASTTTGTATTIITMFRVGTSGALEVNTGAGNTAWRGVHIISPAVTETTGDINVFGADLDMSAVVTTGGDIVGINLVMQGTYTTAGEIGVVATGDGRRIEVLNTSSNWLARPVTDNTGTYVTLNSNAAPILDFDMRSTDTGQIIDMGYSVGTILSGNLVVINFANSAGLTMTTGDLTGIDLDFSTNVTTADNRDILGYNLSLAGLAQTTAVTTNFKGFSIDTAGAISDSSTVAFNWYGTDFVLPAGTVTGTATMTIVGHRIGTAGALNTSTAAGFIDWYGMDIVTPAATAAGIFAQIIDISGFRIGTAGALNSDNALQATNWRGIDVLMPQVATATGTTTVSGLYVQSFTGALLGTNYALNVDWRSTSGTIANIAFGNGAGTTLAGTVIGTNLDLSTNVTINSGGTVRGYELSLAGRTQSTAATTTITGYRIASAGALETNTDGGADIDWTGLFIISPAVTQTLGSTTVYGIDLDMNAVVTTGGTIRGINIVMQTTYTTASEIAVNITGDGRTIEIGNTENAIDIIGAQSATGLLDLNPNGTGTGNIIDITPSAALAAGSTWIGISIDGTDLDPLTGVATTIYGSFYNFAGVASADGNDANVTGYLITLPTGDTNNSFGYQHTYNLGTVSTDQTAFVSLGTNIAMGTNATTTLRGMWLDYDLITRNANAPSLTGVLIDMPADLTGFNANSSAIRITDGTNTTFKLSMSTSETALFDINPRNLGAATIIDIDHNGGTITASQTVFSFDFANAVTLNATVNFTGVEMLLDAANFTLSDDHDITAYTTTLPDLTQATANTSIIAGYRISSAGALIQNTGAGIIRWYGLQLQNPNITATTGTININVIRLDNIATLSEGGGNINWYFINTNTPALSITAGTQNIAFLRNASSGALVTNPGTLNWRGIDLLMPQTTQTAGTLTAYGLYVQSFTGAISGTVNAMRLDWRSTSGTIANISIGTATTLVGALTGIVLDLSTNITATTGMANIDSTGTAITLNPAVTHTTDTGVFTHQNTITGGAITVTPTPGAGAETTTANWYGTAITLPATLNATAAAGDVATITANGLRIIGPTTQTLGGTGTESIRSACIYIDVSRASAANNFSIGIDFAGMAAGELVFAVPDDAQAVPNGGIALPANSTGRIAIDVGGTTRYIPYF